jgi:hypothetical protein
VRQQGKSVMQSVFKDRAVWSKVTTAHAAPEKWRGMSCDYVSTDEWTSVSPSEYVSTGIGVRQLNQTATITIKDNKLTVKVKDDDGDSATFTRLYLPEDASSLTDCLRALAGDINQF